MANVYEVADELLLAGGGIHLDDGAQRLRENSLLQREITRAGATGRVGDNIERKLAHSVPVARTLPFSRSNGGRIVPVSMLPNFLPADSQTQVTDVHVLLAACRGWNVTATVEGRVVAVRHCRDWHRVEYVSSQLRNGRNCLFDPETLVERDSIRGLVS